MSLRDLVKRKYKASDFVKAFKSLMPLKDYQLGVLQVMNTRHIYILIIGLTLFACSSESEWKYIATTNNPDADIYINIKPKNITINGSKRKAWTKWIYKKERTTDNKRTYIETINLAVIDCSENTFQPLEVHYFDHAHNVVDSNYTPYPPPPDSPKHYNGNRFRIYLSI